MAQITLKGNPIHTNGKLPEVGSTLPNFHVTKTDLSDINLAEFSGKNIVLNIFPSIDTPTCANSVRHFNEKANQLSNTVILCVSADLPFALNRFCGAEGLKNVIPVSEFRHKEFGDKLGIRIIDGPIAGLLARSIIVINKKGEIIHTEQVSEIANEPNYDAVLTCLLAV